MRESRARPSWLSVAAAAAEPLRLRRYSRWQEDQPHPSFDVDGDGTISSEDMAIAKAFDKDNNGVLDKEETMMLRTALANEGIRHFSSIP